MLLIKVEPAHIFITERTKTEDNNSPDVWSAERGESEKENL